MTRDTFKAGRNELSAEELHDICANQLGDLEGVRDALLEWIRANRSV